MKRVIQTLAALAVGGAVMAALVVGVGLYNVSAREGHLPGVRWVLPSRSVTVGALFWAPSALRE